MFNKQPKDQDWFILGCSFSWASGQSKKFCMTLFLKFSQISLMCNNLLDQIIDWAFTITMDSIAQEAREQTYILCSLVKDRPREDNTHTSCYILHFSYETSLDIAISMSYDGFQ